MEAQYLHSKYFPFNAYLTYLPTLSLEVTYLPICICIYVFILCSMEYCDRTTYYYIFSDYVCRVKARKCTESKIRKPLILFQISDSVSDQKSKCMLGIFPNLERQVYLFIFFRFFCFRNPI